MTGTFLLMLPFLSPSLASAKPFLVSDPYSKSQIQPTRFLFVCGELRFSRAPETLPDGRKRLKLDLAILPQGETTLEIKAVNEGLRMESKAVEVRLLKKGLDVSMLPPVIGHSPPQEAQEQAPPEKRKIPPSRTYQGHLNGP